MMYKTPMIFLVPEMKQAHERQKKHRKDFEVEWNPEKNTHLPFLKNENSRESGEQRTIEIIGHLSIKDLKFNDF